MPEKGDENFWELIEGNYRLIYQLKDEDRIDVLMVHHSSRPLKNVLRFSTFDYEAP